MLFKAVFGTKHILLHTVQTVLSIIIILDYMLSVEPGSGASPYCEDFVPLFLKKNQNAPRPSEHPPVMGEKCQNV